MQSDCSLYTPTSLGAVDPNSIVKVVKEKTEEDRRREELMASRPPISEILNLHDFEAVAKVVLAPKAWAYYSSAADDEITIRENHNAFQRIWFRPRILRNVEKVDWSHSILGHKTSLPVYIVSFCGRLRGLGAERVLCAVRYCSRQARPP